MTYAFGKLRSLAFSLVALTTALALPPPGHADVAEGVAAFLNGNRIMAWRHLLPAARAGDAEAQFFVGTMYRHGFGTERDDQEGLFWITQAADQGHPQAAFVVGFDLLQQGRPETATPYIISAAEHGFGTAQYHAGLLYRDGTGVAADPYVALGWILRAANQDVVAAQYEAGSLLANPQEGVRPDLIQAHVWFSLAADAGYPGAAQARNSVAGVLTPAQRSQASVRKKDWIAAHR